MYGLDIEIVSYESSNRHVQQLVKERENAMIYITLQGYLYDVTTILYSRQYIQWAN